MSFADDDDRYHKAEIEKRDKRIAELESSVMDDETALSLRISVLEQQLAEAEGLFEDALNWATEWTDASWMAKVQEWLVKCRSGV